MKLSATSVAALSLFTASVSAFHHGFNIAAEKPEGGCKAQADWENNFIQMKSLPGNFRDVRVYASSDCGTLQNAVPAALNQGVQLLVGVWATDENHYSAEKAALLAACKKWGVKWISAISVGSEDLYRGDANPNRLAQQINEVRQMMTTVGGKGIWVGHVDTWTAWVNAANAPVIRACDFVGHDGYPYFQNQSINNAYQVFQDSLAATKGAINRYKPGTPLWITETGWPTRGPAYGPAVASIPNAQRYWKEVWCPISPNYASYAYTLRDYLSNPSFGVLNQNFQPLYDLRC